MKLLVFLICSLFVFVTQARIKVSFLPLNRQAMVLIKDEPGDEPLAYFLYDNMDVPVQDSFIGPGKSISTPNREFNMVCSLSPSQGNQCNFIIQNVAGAHLDPAAGLVEFGLCGEVAAELYAQFKNPHGTSEFLFRSPGDQVIMKSTSSEFAFTAHQ